MKHRLGALLASPTVRVAVLIVLLALGISAVAGQWHDVRPALERLPVHDVALSGLAGLAAIGCAVPAWRSLLADVGSRLPLLPAARVFLLGQLGKFVPGSVWVVVAQTELGRGYGVPRRRSATAGLLAMGVSLATALVTAAAFLPLGSAQLRHRYWWLTLVAVAALALLAPPVLTPVVERGLRLLRREPLERPLSWAGVGRAGGWSIAGWLLYGVHVWLLARGLGGTGALLLARSTGAFAVAWSLGFLVVIAPAGAGIREVALGVALAAALPGGAGAATALAVISRLLLTAGDLVGAGLAGLLGRRLRPRWPLPPTGCRSGRPSRWSRWPRAAERSVPAA